jgi:hypothetical protein
VGIPDSQRSRKRYWGVGHVGQADGNGGGRARHRTVATRAPARLAATRVTRIRRRFYGRLVDGAQICCGTHRHGAAGVFRRGHGDGHLRLPRLRQQRRRRAADHRRGLRPRAYRPVRSDRSDIWLSHQPGGIVRRLAGQADDARRNGRVLDRPDDRRPAWRAAALGGPGQLAVLLEVEDRSRRHRLQQPLAAAYLRRRRVPDRGGADRGAGARDTRRHPHECSCSSGWCRDGRCAGPGQPRGYSC